MIEFGFSFEGGHNVENLQTLIRLYRRHLNILDLLIRQNSFKNMIIEYLSQIKSDLNGANWAIFFNLASWVIFILNKLPENSTEEKINEVINRAIDPEKYSNEEFEKEINNNIEKIDDFCLFLSKIVSAESMDTSTDNELRSFIERIKKFINDIQQHQQSR
ncbi:hypothetical protein HRbin35_00510 [bacterium HR35]|nr:hypothetical protein HRbin35_00510 [bacterium HR35]